jgi:hypothetical protein
MVILLPVFGFFFGLNDDQKAIWAVSFRVIMSNQVKMSFFSNKSLDFFMYRKSPNKNQKRKFKILSLVFTYSRRQRFIPDRLLISRAYFRFALVWQSYKIRSVFKLKVFFVYFIINNSGTYSMNEFVSDIVNYQQLFSQVIYFDFEIIF